MFKHTSIKLAVSLCVLATISMTSGCGENVLGPERSNTNFAEKAPKLPPVILPVEFAPQSADLTGDGVVDASDLAAFASTLAADLNGDKSVGERDELLLGAVLEGVPIDQDGDGFVDASDLAAYAYAKAHADLTGDGVVDASDVAAFAAKRSQGDVNRDGSVSSEDIEVIRRHLGQEIEPAGIVSDWRR